jgi:DNA (cytosine-5)-methyltransferase 1
MDALLKAPTKSTKNVSVRSGRARSNDTGLPYTTIQTLSLFESLEIESVFAPPENPQFTFIDLFAGIGGFRLALQSLGGACVFSSEWDKEAQATYARNFGEIPFGDITQTQVKQAIPEQFDVLCAGFPCQPFSKGGFQQGFEDTRGTLFFDICEILQKHQPKIVLLENVANLVSHDGGNTYQTIIKHLQELGYATPPAPVILSSDAFGVPMLRPRVYIPCILTTEVGAAHLDITSDLVAFQKNSASVWDYLIDDLVEPNLKLTSYEERVLQVWDDFYQGIDLKVIGFPIWADYFRSHGDLSELPVWKAQFIEKNRALYQRNRRFIDDWFAQNEELTWVTPTHRKMEWQAGADCASIFECFIQFRPSGVRVKRPNKFSTLVAMNHQQIIGPLRRRLSVRESQLLQSFPPEYQFHASDAIALKQLGNSVNVDVVRSVLTVLLAHLHKGRA